eukprot:COSAG01_NODE_3211_length_6414_cov_7.800475_6_plen_166_part_00
MRGLLVWPLGAAAAVLLLLCAAGGTHADPQCKDDHGNAKPRQPACSRCIGDRLCARDCKCPAGLLSGCSNCPPFEADSNEACGHYYHGNNNTMAACKKCFKKECPHCYMLGDIFGYFVQGALALLGFSSLMVKRHLEHPPRSFAVWGAFSVAGRFCQLGCVLANT